MIGSFILEEFLIIYQLLRQKVHIMIISTYFHIVP